MDNIKYGRKISGIKRELTKQINDWLSSIEDEDVRIQAEKDVIVTGGSIASMLLGERVNDYDIYFRTKETTIAVAKYYVEQFNKYNTIPTDNTSPVIPYVTTESIANIKGIVEDRVTIYVKSAGIASEEQTVPYQYFELQSEEELVEYAEDLVKNKTNDGNTKYRPIFLSQNAITLSNNFQIVIRFYGSPDDIHNNYDFVHAKCYWDHHNKKLHTPTDALLALLSRTLIYQGSLYPIASIFRMKKFIERGWRITAGQQLKIMWQISEIDLTDKDILREQLTGVDQAYMWQLIEALSNVDDLSKIDSTYVATIIDKIFD